MPSFVLSSQFLSVNKMKANYGSIVVAGRGAIGEKVASRNAYGDFFRARVTPIDNPNTFKTTVRTYFKEASQAWRNLTQAQRNLWNRAVGDFLFTDVFANVKKPSGFNLFVSLCMNRRMSGRTNLTTPPTPRYVKPVRIASIVSDFSGSILTLNLADFLGTNQCILIYATPPFSAGISSYYGRWGFIEFLNAYGIKERGMQAKYPARFGVFPPAGSKIQFKVVTMDTTSGIVSLPQVMSTIILP